MHAIFFIVRPSYAAYVLTLNDTLVTDEKNVVLSVDEVILL